MVAAFRIEKAPIIDFIDNRIILEDPTLFAPNTNKQIVAKTIGISLSALGKIPFIPINLKLKNLGGLRYGLAAGNTLGFWALGSWSVNNIANDLFETLTPEEEVLKDQSTRMQKIASHGSALLMSCASQGFVAYLAYVYNGKNILMPISIMLSDTSFPYYSTLLSSRKVMQKWSFSKFEQKLHKMKQKMISLFEQNKQIFTNMTRLEKKKYLEIIERIQMLENSDERLEAFLPLLLKENEHKQTRIQKIGSTIFGLNGLHFTINHLMLIGIVSYIGGSSEFSSDVAGSVFAIATILSTFYLETKVTIRTAQRFFSAIYNLCTRQAKPTLIEQLRPKLAFTLKALGLLTSVLSWGPTVQVSHDYIKDEGLRTYLQITGSLAVTLLIATAVLDIIDDVVAVHIIKKGTDEERAILKIHKKMNRLIRVFDKSSLIEFAKFTKILPVEILRKMKQKFKITEELLDEYLADKLEYRQELLPLIV